MNPKISITVDAKNKAVVSITGMATVGAKVDVEVKGITESSVPEYTQTDKFVGRSLRFRIVDPFGKDLARFPLVEKDTTVSPQTDGDKWSVTSDVFTNYSGTVLDLDTDCMRRAFCGIPYNEKIEFGVILDSVVDAAEYAIGKIKISQWSVASTEDPTVLPDWRETLSKLNADLASVESSKTAAASSATSASQSASSASASASSASGSSLLASSYAGAAYQSKVASETYANVAKTCVNGGTLDGVAVAGTKADRAAVEEIAEELGTLAVDAVRYTSQSETEERKAQARANVGLGNVDNTSDLAKPVSVATQTLVNQRGVPSGGSAGQILVKRSGSDYDVEWKTVGGGGGGGDISHSEFSSVTDLPQRFTGNQMRNKLNEVIGILRGSALLLFATVFSFACQGEVTNVFKAAKGDIFNDELIVTNVTFDGIVPGDYSNVSNLAVSALQPSDIVNTVESDATNKVLSAKMGKELESQILNIKQRGRYLSIWDSATGLAKTTATVSPYEYKAGDYFIVGTVAAEGGVNYRPDGKAYTNGVPTLTVETNAVHPNDTYYFDSTTWTLVKYEVNLEAYATKEWVTNKQYVTETITNGLARETWVTDKQYVTKSVTNGLASIEWVTNKNYVTESVTNGLASETWVTGKQYVTESVTNGILASAQSYADGYANQAPNYDTVSNRAMTAAQYEQYLDRSSFSATVDALSAGYLIAKSRNAGITTTSPKVLFGSESIGSEGSVYGELSAHWPGVQLAYKSCKVVRDPDFGRLTVSNMYTVAFPEKSGVLALRDELTVFSADASGKKMIAVTPPDAEGHTTTNSVPYTSYVDAATNGLLSASVAELTYKPLSWVPAWGDVTGKPQFAAVATSGSYTDLSNKPDLSAYATEAFVTNRVAAAEALVNQSPCWSTAGAWGIEYKLSATSSSQTIVTGWTNEDGRAWSQMRTHYVRNLEADCFGALYDEITIEALRVGGWRCLTAGGSITAAGHLTANASGVYVVSATNQNGQIRFAEIPISNGAQDVADVEVYVGDVAGTARKAVNDEALAWMNAAPNHGAGIYGTESTWYNWGYFTQPAWAATSAANTGNDKPFALGTKLLAGATHYPDWCKWEGFQTIGSTTVKKGEWVRLDHWALSNGWNGAQVAAMNLSDISLVLVTEGSIPLADCPYLITEAKLNETFAGTLEGVQGWAATQMHADPIQLVYSTADGTAWRYAMGSECNRLDIKTKLLTMGSAYPIHSGDSGHPVYLHHDNKWVLTSHFYSAANGPSYVKALPVIRAFAASVGCSLNVIE